jgi:hypothetical protein
MGAISGAQIVAAAAGVKSGWKTTEFWTHAVIPILGAVAASVLGLPAAPIAAAVAGATTIAYGVGRVVLKAKAHDTAGAVQEAATTVVAAIEEAAKAGK